MSETVYKYSIVDKEDLGLQYTVAYKSRTCCCACNCNDDEIELWEEGEEHPYRLQVQGADMKIFLRGLLDGEWNITEEE